MYLSSLMPAAILAAVIALSAAGALEAAPAQSDMNRASRFARAVFEGVSETERPDAMLEVRANNDPVQQDGRNGRQMNIAGVTYARGLYCHAVSNVVVHLPGPARRFTAVVGVDSNEQTTGGRGSVHFAVSAGGKQLFRSDLMREGMRGVPVSVDLGGAREFVLEVDDGGDGISCDQSDWADARVTLSDGRQLWLGEMLMSGVADPDAFPVSAPFSFKLDGRPSSEFLSSWNVTRKSSVSGGTPRYTVVWTDPKTALSIRMEGVKYTDFPTVEWTLYFKNGGSADSPVISDIRAVDTVVNRFQQGEFVLHHNEGSPCTPTDYQPFATVLPAGQSMRIATDGGRPTNSNLPYFNIEWPFRGVIMVLGWPGQWSADFTRDSGTGLRLSAGQELTHFLLHAGEEVRAPRVVMQFYTGSAVSAQNVWRRWMLAHNVPEPLRPMFGACSSHQFAEMINANDENQKFFIDRYLEEGLKLDFWWMDAGWYVQEGGWPQTGTWEVDRKRFPGGLRSITDHGRAKGVKSIVWFEPERVAAGTWLYDTHPEWLLKAQGNDQRLLNLGNPEAWKWLVEHVDGLIVSEGIDLYRNDFNIDPLDFWRAADTPDRQGITEIRYVEGFLAYWDELRRRHPGMLIDTCASGGRRNDIESLRRSVPLLRSDYIIDPLAQQNHSYGIASWIPFHGTAINSFDTYTFRSQTCPWTEGCYDMRVKRDYSFLRLMMKQRAEFADCWFGDYYPLTTYHPDRDVWMAWQFDLPEKNKGFIQVFRRDECVYEAAKLRLQGLDAEATYRVRNMDDGKPADYKGADLMAKGLSVKITDCPGALIFVYNKLDKQAR